MIDIHSHVFWGLDDGAASLEDSLAMAKDAASTGTTDMVATPHLNARFEYRPQLVTERMAELAQGLGGLGSGPRLHRGCEFHLNFDNIDHLLEQPSTYTINGGPYLLLECPDLHLGKHMERIFERLFEARITPIIAHPERNPLLQQKPEKLEGWVELGCLTQLTALSITGGFGGSAKSASARLLEKGLAHVVASDAHDPVRRHARMDEAYRAVRARFGEDRAQLLFVETPRGIIEGRPVAGGKQRGWEPEPRKYLFWKRRSRD
jgi:protein-tyrosine phosphatase